MREIMWKKQGIDMDNERYRSAVEKRYGRCDICDEIPTDRELSVDHDHTTKAVRGLLCVTCNAAVGMVRESEEIMDRIKRYLAGGALWRAPRRR
jgi:hypothetical protein